MKAKAMFLSLALMVASLHPASAAELKTVVVTAGDVVQISVSADYDLSMRAIPLYDEAAQAPARGRYLGVVRISLRDRKEPVELSKRLPDRGEALNWASDLESDLQRLGQVIHCSEDRRDWCRSTLRLVFQEGSLVRFSWGEERY